MVIHSIKASPGHIRKTPWFFLFFISCADRSDKTTHIWIWICYFIILKFHINISVTAFQTAKHTALMLYAYIMNVWKWGNTRSYSLFRTRRNDMNTYENTLNLRSSLRRQPSLCSFSVLWAICLLPYKRNEYHSFVRPYIWVQCDFCR